MSALATHRSRTSCFLFLRSDKFDMFICLAIVTNVLFFGVEAEYMARMTPERAPTFLKVVAGAYTIFFTLELLLRLLAEGTDFCYSKKWGWNALDTVIVLISALEFFLGLVVDGNEAASSNLAPLRALRIVRMVRILRIARLVKYFRSLRILVYSVLNTLRSLLWTLVLLLIILYVFGLVFTQFTTQYRMDRQDSDVDPNLIRWFGNVERSIYTLFMCVTSGISWVSAADPIAVVHPGMLVVLLIFISFTHFAMLNVVTGVFCQTAIESANADQDLVIQAQVAMKNQYINKLEKLFKCLDTHHTGQITLVELEECMAEEWFKGYFDSMDISADEAFSLYKLLDTRNTGSIDIDAFVTGCLRLRGSAKSIDIAMMLYESRWTMARFMELMNDFHERFSGLQRDLSRVSRPHGGSAWSKDGNERARPCVRQTEI